MYKAIVSFEIPKILDSLLRLTFEPAVFTKYLAICINCLAFLMLYLPMMSLWIISPKYCCRINSFFPSSLSKTTSGNPQNFRYSSRDLVLLNLRNSSNDKGMILNDKFLPVSNVDNSLDNKDAEEPVITNFILSLRSYFVLTHFSQLLIF